ncbi:uncharacterized protein [Solanum lycopersicum]|uniref:uncharacterized protein n=1 Tax=Solanum lycopersicum TaxID=4081 RepID=UPI0037488B8F
MRRFDATDEYTKELRNDLAGIGYKVDTHSISIKHLELQMAQLSATVNKQQLGTLPSNSAQNPKNDGDCMTINTRGGKQTIDPPIPSVAEKVIRDEDRMMEVSVELEDKMVKDVEVPQKVSPMPRPPPPFPQRLAKKTEDADFVILNCEAYLDVPIILGGPFLPTDRSLIDMEKRKMKFRLNNEEVTFNICRSMRKNGELQSVSAISYRVLESSHIQIEERLGVEALEAAISNFYSDVIDEYELLGATLDRGNVHFKPKKFYLDMQHRESPLMKLSIEEAPKLELKPLPPHMRYVLLGNYDTLQVIIASDLNVHQVESLLKL